VLLIGIVFAGWKYVQPGSSAKQAPPPAKTAEPSPSIEQKVVATPKVVPPPVTANDKEPVEHKRLTYEEQAKVIELDSLADIDYNQGGCEKALPTYQQVLEIDPKDPRAYTAVQKCYAKARNGEPIAPSTPPDSSPHP